MSTINQANELQDLPRIETAQAADALCARLLESTADLVGLLERETGLLQRGKAQEIVALQARKTALGALLTRDMAAFRRDAGFIKTAVPERIDAIKAQHAQLQRSLQTNHAALSAMKAVSESLLRTVASKVGQRRSGPEVYGRDAGVSDTPPTGPSAISVDRTL